MRSWLDVSKFYFALILRTIEDGGIKKPVRFPGKRKKYVLLVCCNKKRSQLQILISSIFRRQQGTTILRMHGRCNSTRAIVWDILAQSYTARWWHDPGFNPMKPIHFVGNIIHLILVFLMLSRNTNGPVIENCFNRSIYNIFGQISRWVHQSVIPQRKSLRAVSANIRKIFFAAA